MVGENKIINVKGLEVNLQELTDFLVKAKKQAFAGDGKYLSIENVPGGLKRFVFPDPKGNFYFTDEYRGDSQFSGNESVAIKIPEARDPENAWLTIWQMNYFGGMVGGFCDDEKLTQKTYEFLKKALPHTIPKLPFRGPGLFSSDGLTYFNKLIHCEGIEKFNGEELIFKDKTIQPVSPLTRIFSLNYHGGIIK